MKKSRILVALFLSLAMTASCFLLASCGENSDAEDETTAEETTAEETTAAETEAPKVTAFEITTPPTKTVYRVGEELDLTGMICTVTYDDGSTAEYTDYRVSHTGALKTSDTKITIRYNSRFRDDLEIKVKLDFEGEGTYENPYLISTPEDFIVFTAGCESMTLSGSSDLATSFGYKLFFKQTADIDMTGTTYNGTIAGASSKYGFGGVYDGGGHTIKADIEKSGVNDLSIFPYVTGVVMNLKLEGTIVATAAEYAQPFRTIGEKGAVINVYSTVDVTGLKDANSLTVTLYGMAFNCYTEAMITSSSPDIINSLKTTGSYVNVIHNCTNSSGNSLGNKSGSTLNTDLNEIASKFNDTSKMDAAVALLKTFNENYSADSLLSWEVVDGTLSFKK